MKNLFNVKDFVTIITGSGRGIGLVLAENFYKSGAKVIRIDTFLKKHNKYNFDDFKFDVRKSNSIDHALKKIKKKYDRIDVLINNAGITFDQYNHDTYNMKILERVLSVNLHAAYELTKNVCVIMAQKKKGSIINITSLTSELGFEGNPSYQVSKAALKQFTKAIANDWGKYKIRANNICPGYIKSPMTLKNYKISKKRNQKLNRMILKRFGDPQDLVGACIFLASDSSSYITGTDLKVDGGWLAKGL